MTGVQTCALPISLNFGMQLLVDLVSVRFVDKAGYRVSMIVAHILSAAGLILLTSPWEEHARSLPALGDSTSESSLPF